MAVEESWRRIVAWVSTQAPQTAAAIRPPATADELRATESAFPRSWPDDLREWYRLQDGLTSHQLFTGVLPGYAELLSLKGIAVAARQYQDILEGFADEVEETADADDASAGETAYRFLSAWVPFAEDGTACTMFVDCRPGARYGCVTLFEREDADTGGPTWPSVDAMLADLADALEQGHSCGGWRWRIDNGALAWEPGDD
jgi:cell wall assembly regulator SMI1